MSDVTCKNDFNKYHANVEDKCPYCRIAELEANQRDATHNELHVRVTELLKQKRELEVQLKTCQVWIKEARRIIPLSLEQSIDAAHNGKVVSDE